MRPFSHLSIRSKIIGIILLTNLVGLGLSVSVIIANDLSIFRRQLQERAQALANQVAAYNIVPLLFDDPADTEQSLGALSAEENLLEAYVFDAQGKVFGHRLETDFRYAQPDPQRREGGFRSGALEVWAPVFETGKRIGDVCLLYSTQGLEQTIREYMARMLWVALGIILVSVVLAFLLGRIISRPILQLADVARHISNKGDFSIRVRKIGRDEISILCDVFNDMLGQIQNRQADLERSNRELDHFARATSHDLKAPLRGIATLATWIEEDLRGEGAISDATAERLGLMKGRVKRMEGLIQGILDYSRVGRMDTEIETVDTGTLVREIAEMLSPPPTIEVKAAGEMPIFQTKRVRLQQVLSNLISNAIKYQDKEQGEVVVRAQLRGDWYEFSVQDDGRGISPQFHDKVFLIFQTLQPRDVVESTGVGLALVKKIVEGEGGEVSLESEVGVGSTFRFTWPRIPRATGVQDFSSELEAATVAVGSLQAAGGGSGGRA
jgi:signal transduction histidine kinase